MWRNDIRTREHERLVKLLMICHQLIGLNRHQTEQVESSGTGINGTDQIFGLDWTSDGTVGFVQSCLWISRLPSSWGVCR